MCCANIITSHVNCCAETVELNASVDKHIDHSFYMYLYGEHQR